MCRPFSAGRSLIAAALVAAASVGAAYDPDAQCVGDPAPEAFAFRRQVYAGNDGTCGPGCYTLPALSGEMQVAVAFTAWFYAVKIDGVWIERAGVYPGGITATEWTPTSSGYAGIRVERTEVLNPCLGSYTSSPVSFAEADIAQRTGWPTFTTDLFSAGANLGGAIVDANNSLLDIDQNPYGKLRLYARVHSGSPNIAETEIAVPFNLSHEYNEALVGGEDVTMGVFCADNPDHPQCEGIEPEEPGGGEGIFPNLLDPQFWIDLIVPTSEDLELVQEKFFELPFLDIVAWFMALPPRVEAVTGSFEAGFDEYRLEPSVNGMIVPIDVPMDLLDPLVFWTRNLMLAAAVLWWLTSIYRGALGMVGMTTSDGASGVLAGGRLAAHNDKVNKGPEQRHFISSQINQFRGKK